MSRFRFAAIPLGLLLTLAIATSDAATDHVVLRPDAPEGQQVFGDSTADATAESTEPVVKGTKVTFSGFLKDERSGAEGDQTYSENVYFDAFYEFGPRNSKSPSIRGYPIDGTEQPLAPPTSLANLMSEPVPAYNPEHKYTVTLDKIPADSPIARWRFEFAGYNFNISSASSWSQGGEIAMELEIPSIEGKSKFLFSTDQLPDEGAGDLLAIEIKAKGEVDLSDPVPGEARKGKAKGTVAVATEDELTVFKVEKPANFSGSDNPDTGAEREAELKLTVRKSGIKNCADGSTGLLRLTEYDRGKGRGTAFLKWCKRDYFWDQVKQSKDFKLKVTDPLLAAGGN
jgi:hypothetical protein